VPFGHGAPERRKGRLRDRQDEEGALEEPALGGLPISVTSSPPQLVESTTSGRVASRRVISVEKSVELKRGNISATTRTPGFSASMPAFHSSQESRPQA
jgi:hypothetical protein